MPVGYFLGLNCPIHFAIVFKSNIFEKMLVVKLAAHY
jgi:hypothetical protein